MPYLKSYKDKRVQSLSIGVYVERGQRNMVIKYGEGPRRVPLSMGPGRPRYDTAQGGYFHRNAIRGRAAQMGRFLTKNP